MEVIFLGKLSFLLFPLDFERKTFGSIIKNRSKLIEKQLRKMVVTSNDLILDFVFFTWNRISKNSADNFQQGCPYCNLRVEMNNLRKNIFFSKKLWVSIYTRIFTTMSLDIQRKKIRTFRAALNVSVCKKGWKNVFIGLASILHICSNCDGNTLDFSAKTFLLGSPNCLVRVSTKNSNEVTFFWTFQFQFFSGF